MNNNSNNRWLTVITLVLVTANIITLCLLWTHKRNGRGEQKPPPPAGPVFEFVTHELKLDTGQQATYQKLREEHQAAVKPIQDSIRMAKDDFFALLQQEGAPDSALLSRNRNLGGLEQELNLVTFRHFQKLRDLCNPEQKKIFDRIIEEVIKRMGPPKRQGPPPPGMGIGENAPRKGNRPPPPPGPENQPPPEQ